MSWRVGTDGQRERIVRLEMLQKWLRDKMQASPLHYYRMRAETRVLGEPDPVRSPVVAKPRVVSKKRDEPARGGTDLPDAGVGPESPRPFEPLDTMKSMRGGPEYRELQAALRETSPACRGDGAFTADRIDDATRARLAEVCATCPVLELCRTFAEAGSPGAGFWPGGEPADRRAVA